MRAGRMRELITFQARIDSTANTFGEPSGSWRDAVTVHAFVDTHSAVETSGDQRVISSIYYRIRCRHTADIDAKMRISWRGKILNITGVANVKSRNAEYLIDAYEA